MRSSNEPDENMTQLKKQLVEIKKKSALHSLQLETYEKTLKDVTDSHETKDQEVKVNLETNENKESEIQVSMANLICIFLKVKFYENNCSWKKHRLYPPNNRLLFKFNQKPLQ